MKRLVDRLEYLVIIIPLIVAFTQLYFVEFETLTRWKGGGFGMYSDPHPNSHRFVILEGLKEDSERADSLIRFRIFPLDDRMDWDQIPGNLKDPMKDIYRIGKNAKYFPNRMLDIRDLEYEIEALWGEYSKNSKELIYFPDKEISVQVVEVAISPDYKKLKAEIIFESKLFTDVVTEE